MGGLIKKALGGLGQGLETVGMMGLEEQRSARLAKLKASLGDASAEKAIKLQASENAKKPTELQKHAEWLVKAGGVADIETAVGILKPNNKQDNAKLKAMMASYAKKIELAPPGTSDKDIWDQVVIEFGSPAGTGGSSTVATDTAKPKEPGFLDRLIIGINKPDSPAASLPSAPAPNTGAWNSQASTDTFDTMLNQPTPNINPRGR